MPSYFLGLLTEISIERDSHGDLESTGPGSKAVSRGACPREIDREGHTLICDESRHQGDNEDLWRNHGGDQSWVERVVSSVVVLSAGADASGGLASGATVEATPRHAMSVAANVVNKMAKDSILATFVEEKSAVGG